MQVKLTNIVDKYVRTDKEFISSDGLCYLIDIDDKKILFDTGDQGIILQNNMHLLEIDAKTIDLVVFSHGHWDHTFGIEALMYDRGDAPVLKLVGHPHVFTRRRIKKPILRLLAYLKYKWYNLGFPKLPEDVMSKLEFVKVVDPYEIAPNLTTIGEINEWKEKPSKIDKLTIEIDGKFVKDEILDDLSLVLKTKDGMVLILGCGHAGVLNICARAKEIHPNRKIEMIIGGTHLVALTEEKDLEYVAQQLEQKYDKPQLYFSHCTGRKAIDYMKNYFGKDVVKTFKVGDTLTFDTK
ncbi:MAG: MBL fold metallo-hydrolase [Candidatus Heimdallarchaeota archaeon]|nr:MBL fold metallo-hydrolase [Candidatus Heimdallarchaeota archaeon]